MGKRMVGLKFESENNRGKHVEKTECRTLLSGLPPVFSHPSIKSISEDFLGIDVFNITNIY